MTERHLHSVPPLPEVPATAGLEPQVGGITDRIPEGLEPVAKPVLHSIPEITDSMPFAVSENQGPKHPAQRPPIDRMPTAEELTHGSAYEGESGEFRGAAKFMQLVESYDPNHSLADPQRRTEFIMSATPEDAKDLLVAVNAALYDVEPDGSNLSDREIMLGSGEIGSDTYMVGFIGIHPEDQDEVLGDILHGTQTLAAAGDLQSAGTLAANALVPLQMLKDGNKRTARAMYELISFGYDGTANDQMALRGRLAHTMEARNSFRYSATQGENTRAYAQESMDVEDRKVFEQLNTYRTDFTARSDLRQRMAGIEDPDLRDAAISVLQQAGLGAKYIVEASDPKLKAAYVETRDRSVLGKMVADFCAGFDDSRAAALVGIDRAERKQYMKRLIESSTGEKPLHYVDAMGKTREDVVVTIAA